MTNEFAIAVHTLVFLNHKATAISSDKIAENVCTNPARIRKIIAKLKKAGFIETKEGIGGGCKFVGNADEITLEMVRTAVEAVPVSVSCKTGDIDMDCLIASGMSDIMDDIYLNMNNACRSVLDKITVKDIDNKIFRNKI